MQHAELEAERARYKKRALWVTGIISTLAWLTLAAYLGREKGLLILPVNEVGDYISGVVAPLAFLWLMIGVFLQGMELSLNTEVLKAQVRELEASVRAQEEQSKTSSTVEQHARKQIALIYSKELMLEFLKASKRLTELSIRLENYEWDACRAQAGEGDEFAYFRPFLDFYRDFSPEEVVRCLRAYVKPGAFDAAHETCSCYITFIEQQKMISEQLVSLRAMREEHVFLTKLSQAIVEDASAPLVEV